MRIVIFYAAVCLLVLLSPLSYAQSLYIEGGVGANLGETQPDSARGSVGVTFDNLRGSLDVDRMQIQGGHAVNVDATGALEFAPEGLLNPYLSGGYGHTFEGTNGVATEGDGLHYGGGVALQPACNLAIDAGVRWRERNATAEPEPAGMLTVRVGGGRRCSSGDVSWEPASGSVASRN